MTDHYDEMRVAPDRSQAEALRQRLHARLARVVPADDAERVAPSAEVVMHDGPTPSDRSRPKRLLTAAAAAVVIGSVVIGISYWTAGDDDRPLVTDAPTTAAPPTDAPLPGDVPKPVRRLVDAINTQDVDTFLEIFTPKGTFLPRGRFAESRWAVFGGLPKLGVEEVPLVEAWFAINDAWDVEVELRSCARQPVPAGEPIDASVECEVSTRWHTLSTEIIEGWDVELRDGEVTWWGASADLEELDQLDLDPSERSLPLGYSGLEDWESWLAVHHREDAAAWLNRRNVEQSIYDAIGDPALAARVTPLLTEADDGWPIEGHQFTPLGLIPYDPAFAEQIEASIHEYLDQQ